MVHLTNGCQTGRICQEYLGGPRLRLRRNWCVLYCGSRSPSSSRVPPALATAPGTPAAGAEGMAAAAGRLRPCSPGAAAPSPNRPRPPSWDRSWDPGLLRHLPCQPAPSCRSWRCRPARCNAWPWGAHAPSRKTKRHGGGTLPLTPSLPHSWCGPWTGRTGDVTSMVHCVAVGRPPWHRSRLRSERQGPNGKGVGRGDRRCDDLSGASLRLEDAPARGGPDSPARGA